MVHLRTKYGHCIAGALPVVCCQVTGTDEHAPLLPQELVHTSPPTPSHSPQARAPTPYWQAYCEAAGARRQAPPSTSSPIGVSACLCPATWRSRWGLGRWGCGPVSPVPPACSRCTCRGWCSSECEVAGGGRWREAGAVDRSRLYRQPADAVPVMGGVQVSVGVEGGRWVEALVCPMPFAT